MPHTSVVIRPILDSDCLEQLTQLLHQAYAIRLEEGFRFFATHQDVEVTRERVQQGHCVVADLESKIVGTATIRPLKPDDRVEYYRRSDAWSFGQFGVLPEYRGQGIGKRLYDACEKYAQANGAKEIGLDTPEHAHNLIAMYNAWGFEIVGEFDYPHTNYKSVIMGKRVWIDD
ncbi:MAG: GNAT family N-acetyltransferase [Fimbriimonadaceae bacterium]|nr:GNAT family N-acetyltransferase [Fimbriimonadaceae bacterium]